MADSRLSRWKQRGTFSVPPPDTPGGLAIAGGIALAIVYLIVVLSVYSNMLAFSWSIVFSSLVVGFIGTFGLAMMLGTDIALFQRLDLDLAETILSVTPYGAAPAPEAPVAGVWRAYVTTSEEARRVARVHAYAFGPFLVGTVISLAASLLVGLGLVSTTNNVIGLALVLETFGLVALFVGGVTLLLTVGYASPVPGFDFLAAKRWRRNATRAHAIDEALTSVPWLREFHRGTRESRPSSGSMIVPEWFE
jgi:hypothetical protein